MDAAKSSHHSLQGACLDLPIHLVLKEEEGSPPLKYTWFALVGRQVRQFGSGFGESTGSENHPPFMNTEHPISSLHPSTGKRGPAQWWSICLAWLGSCFPSPVPLD